MRILTGIKSTNIPHLGNILGAIQPALHLSQKTHQSSLFFIANLHALTTHPNPPDYKKNIQATASSWLACGLDPTKDILYRQSHLPLVCELAWYLTCLTPYTTLTRSHAFKDKANNLTNINLGLFTYPILMAADILLYQATHIPVGKDQLQHIEITRQLAKRFNNQYGNIFTIPQAYLQKDTPTVPGIDGRKMSKSYGNTISPFMPEKQLYKTIMAIPTESTPLASPKDPDKCAIFNIYRLIANQNQQTNMRNKYIQGNYGYGQAKKTLFKLITTKFSTQRTLFNSYMANNHKLEAILIEGEKKANTIAQKTLQKVRHTLGINTSLPK